MTAYLSRIAVLNLKKMPGGSSADTAAVMKAALADAAFIKEQIDLYEPALLVACGTGVFCTLEAIYQKSEADRLCRRDPEAEHDMYFTALKLGRVVMDFWHPQPRVTRHRELRRLFADSIRCLASFGLVATPS